MIMNWLNYNVSQQSYSPKTFTDVITNKFNKIHERLFEDAKNKAIINTKTDDGEYLFKHVSVPQDTTPELYNCILCDANNNVVSDINSASFYIDLDDYKLIEHIPEDRNHYLLPSYLIITNRIIYNDSCPSINRVTIDLDPWWENEYEISKIFDGSSLQTNNLDDWYPYNDIIYYDYIKGKATLENRVEMKTRKINFENISVNDEIKIDYTL